MFADRLRKIRKDFKLTQKELAQKLGVSHQTIGHYELGRAKPDIKTLCKIADEFGCTVDYLLGRDKEHYQPSISGMEMEDVFKYKVFFDGRALDDVEKKNVIVFLRMIRKE